MASKFSRKPQTVRPKFHELRGTAKPWGQATCDECGHETQIEYIDINQEMVNRGEWLPRRYFWTTTCCQAWFTVVR